MRNSEGSSQLWPASNSNIWPVSLTLPLARLAAGLQGGREGSQGSGGLCEPVAVTRRKPPFESSESV